MTKPRLLIAILYSLFVPALAGGQTMDVVGSRAAGMGGAFVGVADDASAVYWNPAGLAGGSYFSLVLDGGAREAIPDGTVRGSKQSSFLLGISMPALGLSYYRLRHSVAGPDPLVLPEAGQPGPVIVGDTLVGVQTLVTHHAGATFVQSLTQNIAVGSTLKVVRGIAATRISELSSAEEALDADDPDGRGTTRVDLDLGVMVTAGRFKAGVTARNLREPEFTSEEGQTLRLERQARAGASFRLLPGLLVASDFDLLKGTDAFGERLDAAFGVEGRVVRRAWVRTGFRFNMLEDDRGVGNRRAFTAGATFAVTASVMLDGLVISAGDHGGSGWGISGRFVY
jgi:F plasmid transfer operon, TraF, protein